ncbi:hypothetical protein EX895_002497 [Sporisorium graminicola]|uniref:Uncharacterized protein n=1 Tax=Sporisorium graminicola TaxID=280036 RepID=A0A4V6EVQ3_9BASI|nr:hypothetical protein EX895_002497 [Sporisorium graminicola]TKY88509.1 hypothetical protein EX895_002497 [Sporisorium graminicola]
MTSTSLRRLPMRSAEQQQHTQDENAFPTKSTRSCSAQMALGTSSPSTSVSQVAAASIGRMRSPSKLPTLSDIAARLNRDRETTPSSSPIKQRPFSTTTTPDATGADAAARPRLELTGRITGSPKPPAQPYSDRNGPVLSSSAVAASALASPSKLGNGDAGRINEQWSLPSVSSPKATGSGASSPSKRMLAKGLPSLEEIRDRMARKGLASGDEGSPQLPLTPPSPAKPVVFDKSPEAKQPSVSPVTAKPAVAEQKPPAAQSLATKPVGLRVATSPGLATPSGVRLNHPLPAPPSKSPTYPLQHEWTLFFDSRATAPPTPGFAPSPADVASCSSSSVPSTPTSLSAWEANLRTIGSYSHVSTFLSCFSKLHRPSQLERHSSYHVFKDGIKPMWEDPRNADGGKWVITFRQRNAALVDRSWLWLVLGLIGEELDGADECCGAVCSVKPRGDRIALWIKKGVSGVDGCNRVGRRLVELLELEREPGVLVEFSSHSSAAGAAKEGLWTLNNPVQVIRSPNVATFAAGGSDSARLSPGSAQQNAPLSPQNRTARAVSPNPNPFTEPYSRLTGQHTSTTNMFGRSSPIPAAAAQQPAIGTLGQSLGLGIGNASPNSSPNLSDTAARTGRKLVGKNSFSGQTGEMAFSWRNGTARSPSPQRKDGAWQGAERSRSSSPFKP